ncbi:MAG: NADH-ubiquinone oxidoreductase chain J [uncultured Thermomicrobiales bacterium]|uniref:NADH-quinone oxidoreductase subunit J n=1 Tax=uncultured Thermomicrobiales bacterium TaxID=1645740 RepID=A0A6J4TAU8_9BACT|nr:MAG: NADH-ubiquinone oxidoreductase chain J [uncultured Thermomicrobiales bacterium]
MPWDVIIFYLIAAVCITSAVGVVVANNPVHAGVFLVICFLNIAATFVMMGAEFLAVVQVIVYTGAILVLVLFVLMLVDPDDLPEFHTARPVQRVVGLLLGAILLLEVGAAILSRTVTGARGDATAQNIAAAGGNTQALGRVLYSDYLLAFEVVSLVLLVGVIGAIVLALPERLGEQISITRRGTISLGHPRGTDAALPAGPAGETPMVDRETPSPTPEPTTAGGRTLIMVTDPDERTTVGTRP